MATGRFPYPVGFGLLQVTIVDKSENVNNLELFMTKYTTHSIAMDVLLADLFLFTFLRRQTLQCVHVSHKSLCLNFNPM